MLVVGEWFGRKMAYNTLKHSPFYVFSLSSLSGIFGTLNFEIFKSPENEPFLLFTRIEFGMNCRKKTSV